jgi:hypothetical protein
MDKTSDQLVLEAYEQEYEKQRDEIQNRIGIQNNMAERAISITVLLGSVLAALFTFFMKDFTAQSFTQRMDLFVSVCVPVLFVHGTLAQFTLAAWIYQLSIMFRIVRYWNWMVENKVEPVIGTKGDVYLWDRHPNPPWDLAVDTKVVRYFQPLFVYGLCAVGLLGLPLACWWQPQEAGFWLVRSFGISVSIGLIVTLCVLAVVHLKVVRGTEAFRLSVSQVADDRPSPVTTVVKPEKRMETQHDFRKAYFVQTRQEIDTEKRERDHILHLVVLVLGALGFAIIQSEKAQEFLKNRYSLLMDAGTVVLFMALFWLRRAKMQQIADRWFVLRSMLKSGDIGIPEDKSLEALVTTGLQGRRYLRKDWVVCWAVCIPLAGPAAMTLHYMGWYPGHIIATLAFAIVALGALAWLILMRRLKCPNAGTPAPGTDSSKPASEG